MARPECNVMPDRIGESVHGIGRLRRLRISVYPDIAEVAIEATLNEVAGCRIEGLAVRRQDFLDDGRRGSLFRAFRTDTFGLHQRRHAHHLVGDSVGFMLQRIVDGAYLELRLKAAGGEDRDLAEIDRGPTQRVERRQSADAGAPRRSIDRRTRSLSGLGFGGRRSEHDCTILPRFAVKIAFCCNAASYQRRPLLPELAAPVRRMTFPDSASA